MFSVNNSWVYLRGAGCPVGSNHFVGKPLCVEVPIRVLRVFLGSVTCFWSTFVLGGGGGLCDIPWNTGSAGTLYTSISPPPPVPQGPSKM